MSVTIRGVATFCLPKLLPKIEIGPRGRALTLGSANFCGGYGTLWIYGEVLCLGVGAALGPGVPVDLWQGPMHHK